MALRPPTNDNEPYLIPLDSDSRRSGGSSTRGQLVAFALALSAPILAFVAILLWQFAAAERAHLEADALAKARTMAVALDRELTGLTTTLEVLSTSADLKRNDFEAFHRRIIDLRERQGLIVLLRDLSGQQLVNARRPYGVPLPNEPLDADAKVLETKRPYVSDVIIGAVAQTPLFTIEAPVLRDGEVAYFLNLSLPLDRIRDLIVSEEMPRDWIATVVDRNGLIVARNTSHEKFAGKRASAALLANTTGQEGVYDGLTLEGVPVLSSYSRSRLSDWRVALGVAREELNAPLQRSLWWFAGLGSGILVLSTLLAFVYGRRIAAPIGALANRALALGRGELVQPLQCPSRDVNRVSDALAEASLRLRDREAELRRSEARYRLVVENATEYAIITMDLAGRITGWNTGAEAVLGWSRDEVTGESADFFFLAEDRRAGVPEAEMGKALKEGRASDERWHVRRDGTQFFAAGVLVPKRDDTGALLGFLKILRDRTKEREIEEAQHSLHDTLEYLVAERTAALEAAHDRLVAEAASRERAEEALRQAQKMEAVGNLTGGIAHDFNNLLTIISGSLDMLRRRVDIGDARALRLVDQAIEGANRAAALTHRLLAFSRQQPLAPEPVDPNKLVAGMSDLLRRTLGENVAIETVLAGGLWRTHADRNQLENALLNLAVNARDAMLDGGKLTIETANAHLDEAYAAERRDVTPGQYVMIAVCDTGAGMPPDVIARAFEPFFTTKPVGKGTGLGLSQVYGFAKQSGGHVAIYSEPGHGTTVKLYLPRFRQADERAEHRSDLGHPERTAVPNGQGETILVVEDEAMVREFSVAALEEAGYRVLAAEDGPSGLALLDAYPEAALLFTDVVLTGPLNGRKIADEAWRRRPGLKVLFTTGYTRNAIIHHGRLDEGVNLIGKPFSAAALAERVRRLLDEA